MKLLAISCLLCSVFCILAIPALAADNTMYQTVTDLLGHSTTDIHSVGVESSSQMGDFTKTKVQLSDKGWYVPECGIDVYFVPRDGATPTDVTKNMAGFRASLPDGLSDSIRVFLGESLEKCPLSSYCYPVDATAVSGQTSIHSRIANGHSEDYSGGNYATRNDYDSESTDQASGIEAYTCYSGELYEITDKGPNLISPVIDAGRSKEVQTSSQTASQIDHSFGSVYRGRSRSEDFSNTVEIGSERSPEVQQAMMMHGMKQTDAHEGGNNRAELLRLALQAKYGTTPNAKPTAVEKITTSTTVTTTTGTSPTPIKPIQPVQPAPAAAAPKPQLAGEMPAPIVLPPSNK